MISIIYLVELAQQGAEPTAQDDAASAAWYDLKTVLKQPDIFAFDHHSILMELCEKKFPNLV